MKPPKRYLRLMTIARGIAGLAVYGHGDANNRCCRTIVRAGWFIQRDERYYLTKKGKRELETWR